MHYGYPQVVSGHLQVDNCTIEDGQVSINSPGSAHFRYCSFVRTQVTCSHVTMSVIENCEFVECETCAVVVEGPPASETNWVHKYLLHTLDTYQLHRHLLRSTPGCHEECSIADFDIGSSLTLNQLSGEERRQSNSIRSYLLSQDAVSQPESEDSTSKYVYSIWAILFSNNDSTRYLKIASLFLHAF